MVCLNDELGVVIRSREQFYINNFIEGFKSKHGCSLHFKQVEFLNSLADAGMKLSVPCLRTYPRRANTDAKKHTYLLGLLESKEITQQVFDELDEMLIYRRDVPSDGMRGEVLLLSEGN